MSAREKAVWLLKGWRGMRSKVKGQAGQRALWPVLALLLLTGFTGSAYGLGAQYIDAYNVLYRMVTNRCAAAGLDTSGLQPKAADADSVTQSDLGSLRSAIRTLMHQCYLVPPSGFRPEANDEAEAFPFMESALPHAEGPFTRMPAEFTVDHKAVYGTVVGSDSPLLWVHFKELHEYLSAMRYTLRGGYGRSFSRNANCGWTANGEQNFRLGQSSGNLSWSAAKAAAAAKFLASALTVDSGSAPAYSTVGLWAQSWSLDRYGATALARSGYFRVSNIPALPHRARFYARAEAPRSTGVWRAATLWANPLGSGGLEESRWVPFGGEQGTASETTRTSERLGSIDISPIDWCPGPPDPRLYNRAQLEIASGFEVVCAAVVLEWTDLTVEPLLQPADDDTEQDGLVDAGCECTACGPEADAGWAALMADAAIRFPLGLSSGRTTAGVRVKAYVSERLLMGVPRQAFSLSTSLTTHKEANGSWKMATVIRPNGTEVVFALTGEKAGQPAEGRKAYRMTEESGAYAIHFAGGRPVTHSYIGGELRQVRVQSEHREITVSGKPNAWPGLTVRRTVDAKIAGVDHPLGSAVPAYSGALIASVDYRSPAGESQHITKLRTGSRIVDEIDGQGHTNRMTRISVARGRTTVDTMDAGGTVLRRAMREEKTDASGAQRTVLETVEVAPGTAHASSHAVTRLFRAFPWGWELVREEEGSGQSGAPASAWTYNTNALDTGSYGRVQGVLHPDGGWARFEYEAKGRVAARVAPFGNGGPDAPAAESAVVTNWYAGDPQLAAAGCPADLACVNDHRPRAVIALARGVEVSRTYHAYLADQCIRKRCARAGARYDDPENLTDTTCLYTNGLYDGRPRWQGRADGTFTVYAYGDAAGQLVTTQRSGEGSAAAVTNGTETITTTDAAGNVASTLSRDILSGITVAGTGYQRDALGRVTRTMNALDGTYAVTAYGCCGPESETDAEGITTLRSYDGLKQVESVERLGVGERYVYNSRGSRVQVVRSAAGESATVAMEYDEAGRRVAASNELDAVTHYAFETNAAGGERILTTFPDGGTLVEDAYRDGRPWAITGTAVAAACFVYGVDTAGPFTVEYRGADTNATEWVKSWQNQLGQPARVAYPDGYTRETRYDARGRATAEADGFTTNLTEYNGLGEAHRSAVDMNGNGAIDLAGPDRVGETEAGYAYWSGRAVREARVWAYPEAGAAERKLVSLSRSDVDGTAAWSEAYGRTNSTRVVRDRTKAARTETATAPDGSRDVSEYTNGLLMAVTRFDREGAAVAGQRRGYDAWGRMAEVREVAAGGNARVTRSSFDIAGRVTNVTVTADGRTETTGSEYDVMGRPVRTVRPDDGEVEAKYDLRGNLTARAGGRTYPVGYGYDAQGRLATLSTYRDGTNGAAAVTRWEYDAARGWPSSKQYADGSQVSYTFLSNGAPSTRTWARGVVTRNAYDAGGALTHRAYSDGTPAVSYGLDREGRAVRVSDGAGEHALRYGEDGQVVEEEQGLLPGGQVAYGRDALGRRIALQVRASADAAPAEVGYGYDVAGRLARVTASGGQDTVYSYGADGVTVTNIAFGNGLATARQFDGFGQLLSSRTAAGGIELGGSVYGYDAAGQRVTNALPDGTRWAYDYDPLGQLKAARRRWADGAPVGGCQFEYAYDTIGNRTGSCMPAGQRTRGREYTANALNQYEAVTVPGQVWVTGTAASNAMVSVQPDAGQARLANRHGDYFSALLDVDNQERARAVTNTVRASLAEVVGNVTSSLVRAEARTELLPRTPERFKYDADGNLLSDGLWSYAWDAENRLTSVESVSDILADHRIRLAFAYDHIGRRVGKKVFAWDTDRWSATTDHFFLYDGWNVVREVRSQKAGVSTNTYVWGLDLSGSLQGAGGIGGLIRIFPADPGSLTPVFDGHGNVTALVDSGSPTNILARYEYGPFGEVLAEAYASSSARQLLAASGFRFSTKYRDEETGLLYYGYRYYSPGQGRWLSRDPIEESGGVNLYGFAGNAPASFVDPLGQALYAFDGTGARYETWSHIAILHRSYRGTAWYKEGVGSRWFSSVVGGATGLGGSIRLNDMYELLVETYSKGDHDIDIIGFSRGASLAREFANMIYEKGIAKDTYRRERDGARGGSRRVVDTHTVFGCDPKIRFVGLFDTVGSFGIPGNDINLGIRMGLPPNVEHAAQAIAKDERRAEFPLTPINVPAEGQQFSQRLFSGDHSDIGGGHEENQNLLALAPLFYIWSSGRAAQVPFGPLDVVIDQGQQFIEVAGTRRPWAYHPNTTPHDLTTSILYRDGGPRRNLPGRTL
jgi:RHS repeat-associated protein